MEPFQRIDSPAVPVARPNVDTDQILPARFLQKPRSDNFGEYLFRDVRQAEGRPSAVFPVDAPEYRGARVLVAARNFGCGSSREHAVWALVDHGFRAVIAPSFGDIFRANGLKNGLLAVPLPEAAVAGMLSALAARPGARVQVDLAAQRITGPGGESLAFDVDPFSKQCLLEGLDELGYTLGQVDAISEFEKRYQGTT